MESRLPVPVVSVMAGLPGPPSDGDAIARFQAEHSRLFVRILRVGQLQCLQQVEVRSLASGE